MSDDLYARLNVPRDADAETIKKAYRKMAVTVHPDKGGDEEEFKKIQEAYAVLSDEQKRHIYDQTGSIDGEGFEGGGGNGMEDIAKSLAIRAIAAKKASAAGGIAIDPKKPRFLKM